MPRPCSLSHPWLETDAHPESNIILLHGRRCSKGLKSLNINMVCLCKAWLTMMIGDPRPHIPFSETSSACPLHWVAHHLQQHHLIAGAAIRPWKAHGRGQENDFPSQPGALEVPNFRRRLPTWHCSNGKLGANSLGICMSKEIDAGSEQRQAYHSSRMNGPLRKTPSGRRSCVPNLSALSVPYFTEAIFTHQKRASIKLDGRMSGAADEPPLNIL